MNDSYAPVLKMLSHRNETDTVVLAWILIVLFGMPILLYLVHKAKIRLQALRNRNRGFETLDRLGNQKDLDYHEQQVLENMAEEEGVKNPGLLLSSINVFDRTVSDWMKKVQRLPWLEMLTRVERLQSIRQKVGYRYLPEGHPPLTTRELRIGQRLYIVAPFQGKLQLLSTRILDLDDLAIRTDYFTFGDQHVQFKEDRDMWVFFWSDAGGEYQFKTRVLKNFKRPVGYSMLKHGDTLVSQKGRKIFSCDLDMEITARWAHTRDERRVASVSLLKDRPKTLVGRLVEVSGSGFSIETNAEVGFNDLIRLAGGVPEFLKDKIGRAVDVSDYHLRFKFHNLSAEEREEILSNITPKLSMDVFQNKSSGRKKSVQT